MPRFVILEHDHPVLHWDLMLEHGASLWTWRLDETPRPGCDITATRIANHRTVYLDYEGPVSGNRGVVRRVSNGTLEWLEQSADRVVLSYRVADKSGLLTLTLLNGDAWLARFEE